MWRWPTSSSVMLYFLMMVNLGKEKPSNDKKGHRGWYLPGSTWKRIERVVRKTWRSLIVPERRSQNAWWEESRTHQKSEELREPRTREDTTSYPWALHLPWQEECDCSILSCSLSPSCGSPWVHSDLGFQIWGWGPPVPTSTETASPWGRGWSIQGQW